MLGSTSSRAVATIRFDSIAISGTTPRGSLETFRYAYAGYLGGFCAEGYVIDVKTTRLDESCALDPRLTLGIRGPFGPTTVTSVCRSTSSRRATSTARLERLGLVGKVERPAHRTGIGEPELTRDLGLTDAAAAELGAPPRADVGEHAAVRGACIGQVALEAA